MHSGGPGHCKQNAAAPIPITGTRGIMHGQGSEQLWSMLKVVVAVKDSSDDDVCRLMRYVKHSQRHKEDCTRRLPSIHPLLSFLVQCGQPVTLTFCFLASSFASEIIDQIIVSPFLRRSARRRGK